MDCHRCQWMLFIFKFLRFSGIMQRPRSGLFRTLLFSWGRNLCYLSFIASLRRGYCCYPRRDAAIRWHTYRYAVVPFFPNPLSPRQTSNTSKQRHLFVSIKFPKSFNPNLHRVWRVGGNVENPVAQRCVSTATSIQHSQPARTRRDQFRLCTCTSIGYG